MPPRPPEHRPCLVLRRFLVLVGAAIYPGLLCLRPPEHDDVYEPSGMQSDLRLRNFGLIQL